MQSNFKTITGERICLRALQDEDVSALHAYRTERDVARYQSWDTDYSLDEARTLINTMTEATFGTRGAWYQIGIVMIEKDELVGDIGVFFDGDDGGAAEVGYTLGTRAQGKGVATEALGLLLDYLALTQGITKVSAVTDLRNQPSRRLLKRLGFKDVKVLEQNGFYKGEWCDEVECLWTAPQQGSV